MNKKVNLENCFSQFSDTFSPKIVGSVNSQNIMVARLEGDKVPWHTHENEDEMFLVVEGTLDVFERDKQVTLSNGEFYVVEKGVEHKVVPRGHVKLVLIETKGSLHTGAVESEITRSEYDVLDA